MRRALLVLALIVLNSDTHAEAPGARPSWRWSSEERIAARFDPSSTQARKGRASGVKAPPATYVIEGRHDPALFFPWELFDSFVAILEVNPSRSAQARPTFKRGIEAQGWDYDQFWRDAEVATASYIASRRQQLEHRIAVAKRRKAARVRVNGGVDGYLQNELCYERARALENLREKLGREPFDRFLYQVVAPGVTLIVAEERDAEMLLRIERGCR